MVLSRLCSHVYTIYTYIHLYIHTLYKYIYACMIYIYVLQVSGMFFFAPLLPNSGCTSLCGVKSILQVPTRNLQLGFLNPFVVGSEEIYI